MKRLIFATFDWIFNIPTVSQSSDFSDNQNSFWNSSGSALENLKFRRAGIYYLFLRLLALYVLSNRTLSIQFAVHYQFFLFPSVLCYFTVSWSSYTTVRHRPPPYARCTINDSLCPMIYTWNSTFYWSWHFTYRLLAAASRLICCRSVSSYS